MREALKQLKLSTAGNKKDLRSRLEPAIKESGRNQGTEMDSDSRGLAVGRSDVSEEEAGRPLFEKYDERTDGEKQEGIAGATQISRSALQNYLITIRDVEDSLNYFSGDDDVTI